MDRYDWDRDTVPACQPVWSGMNEPEPQEPETAETAATESEAPETTQEKVSTRA